MQKIIILPVIVFIVLVLTCPGMSQTINSDDAEAYVAVIDELITNCEKKSAMGNSASDNIRNEVSIALMKASFYKKNKELLIEEMMEMRVDPKLYKVQYFLNMRFFAIVRDHNPQVAEAYSEPDEVHLPSPEK